MMKTAQQMNEEFPFLKCTKDNPWCYGNSDEFSWWNNLDEGWQIAFGEQMFQEIKDCLIKHNQPLESFIINQLKEKWSELRLYYQAPSECYEELDKIIDKYTDISYNTCINCGKPAKYHTKGYILPYCENCVKPEWKVYETD